MALTDSLDELITSGAITPQLAMKVLQQVCLLPWLVRGGVARAECTRPHPRSATPCGCRMGHYEQE
jgi:hypothetical protein